MTRHSRGRFARNLGALYLLHGANIVVPLVLVPYLTRVLAAETYGLVSFGQAFVWFFLLAVSWGFGLSATRDVAVARDDPVALGRLVADVLGAKLALLAASSVVFLVLLFAVPELRAHAPLHLMLFATVVGNAIFPVWLFQGLERMVVVAAINAGLRFAGLAATIALVREPADGPLYAALLGLQWLAAGGLGLLLVGRVTRLVPRSPTRQGMRRVLVEGWPLFLSNVANTLYTSVNPFLLGLFASYHAVGFYSGAERVMFGLVSLLTPLSQAFFPHISHLQATAPHEAFRIARRLLVVMVGLATVFAVTLGLGAPLVARLYLGEGFAEAAPVMMWLAPVVPLLALVNVLGQQIMVPLGRDRAYRNVLIATAAINILGAMLLAPSGGAEGMAVAVLLSAGTAALGMTVYLARRGLLPFVAEHAVARR